jgi:hypothetical protein
MGSDRCLYDRSLTRYNCANLLCELYFAYVHVRFDKGTVVGMVKHVEDMSIVTRVLIDDQV